MTTRAEVEARAIRRILIALDASAHSVAALEAAVKLAAGLQAEVTGLFVEDAALLASADLPITREVGTFSGSVRAFDRGDVERQLRAQASEAHRALAAHAGHARVSWSFRVARGSVTGEVLSAAKDADLVTVGSHGSRLMGWRGVGSTTRAVVSGTRCPVLMTRHGAHVEPPVMAVYDGTPAARVGLEVAAQVARAMEDVVIVLTADDGSGTVEALAHDAAHRLDDAEVDAHLRRFNPSNPEAIIGMVHDMGCGVLVLPADSPWLSAEVLQAIARRVHCPVLLTRERAEARRRKPRPKRRAAPAAEKDAASVAETPDAPVTEAPDAPAADHRVA
jgi:nucleotide-binding universal stress UspA family protein